MQMPQPAVPSYGHLRLWISSHRLALKTHNFTVEINMFTATNISKSLKFFVWILFMCKLWPVQGYQSKSKLKPPTIESNAVPYEDHTQSSQCTAHTHTNSVTCSCYKDFHKSEASVSLLPPALLGSFTAPLPVLPDSLSAPPPHRCWPPPQGFCLHLQLPATSWELCSSPKASCPDSRGALPLYATFCTAKRCLHYSCLSPHPLGHPGKLPQHWTPPAF